MNEDCCTAVCEREDSDLEKLRTKSQNSLDKLKSIRARIIVLVNGLSLCDSCPESCENLKKCPENRIQEIHEKFEDMDSESNTIGVYLDMLEKIIR